MPKGIPLTQPEQAQRRRQIAAAAAHLFIENGFVETSMRQVALAAGVGKSTLYDYFKTKDEILVSIFVDELQAMTSDAHAIDKKDLPVEEKLRQIMQMHLEHLLANKNSTLRLSIETQRLNAQGQQLIQASRHAYQDLITRLIERGITQGIFRPVDARLTMRVILAALAPVVFTTRPTGTPQEMLTATIDILLKGILA